MSSDFWIGIAAVAAIPVVILLVMVLFARTLRRLVFLAILAAVVVFSGVTGAIQKIMDDPSEAPPTMHVSTTE